ncbi:MAG: hypothetical protein JWM42_751 [Burkholderia sp.]|nr:hypothetical protein [Burkholderia sp.]
MRWALQEILARPPAQPHVLSFLVNPTTKSWYGRYGSRRESAQQNEHHPAVQAGHLVTFAALDDTKNERLALQDADENQELNYTVESKRDDKGFRIGAFAINDAVSIGGIPVMYSTAKMWEATDMLPKGTLADAEPHLGWARI